MSEGAVYRTAPSVLAALPWNAVGDPAADRAAYDAFANGTQLSNLVNVATDKPRFDEAELRRASGLLDGVSLPNKAFFVVLMKPFEERKTRDMSAFAALRSLNRAFQALPAANVFAFNLPPIAGLGSGAGFEFQLQSVAGAAPEDLAAVARAA